MLLGFVGAQAPAAAARLFVRQRGGGPGLECPLFASGAPKRRLWGPMVISSHLKGFLQLHIALWGRKPALAGVRGEVSLF